MSTNLSTKYDMRVPRYTSYPTAPHFHQEITGDTYKKWLSELDPAVPLSLYFHIPFCDSMCWFCGCYTKIVNRYEPVRDYLEVILKEIDIVADALPGRFTARHLHWGGGSPTMLTGDDWRKIMDKLRDHFDVNDDSEIAVECDPRDVKEDYIIALADAGVNRASIGVQDYDPVVQEAVNRIQPFEVTKQVIEWLRKHGIENINMDLMYGLPHQNNDRIADMVKKTLSLKPHRIALFGYAHVPWMKSHMKMIDESALPNTEERWEQFNLATQAIVDGGYVKIGFDHFARPDDTLARALDVGKLQRNFQGYSADKADIMLGFGASAIGHLPQGYVQNLLPLRDYKRHVDAGTLPTGKGIEFSEDDKLRGAIITKLMCDMEVDVEEVCKDFGEDFSQFTDQLAKLQPMAADAMLTLDGGKITMTEQGRPLVRLAAAVFDAYLKPGEQKHSKAV